MIDHMYAGAIIMHHTSEIAHTYEHNDWQLDRADFVVLFWKTKSA